MRSCFGKRIRWSACFTALLILSAWGVSPAVSGDDPLLLEMTGRLVVFFTDDAGKTVTKLTPLPEVVEQGDIIQYDITGKNVSNKALSNIRSNGKIPEGTFFIENSPRCDLEHTVMFSIDNGKTFSPAPITETVVTADGKETKSVVSPNRYTDIQFVIKKLEPGQEFKGSYGVTVQ